MTAAAHPARETATELYRSLLALMHDGPGAEGDLRRTAAIYVAKRAKSPRSRLQDGLAPSVDPARLSEAPYLAALGYLVGACVLDPSRWPSLKGAVEKVGRRSLQTAEGAGLGDDPVVACGLLLLADATGNASLSRMLRERLADVSPDDASVLLIARLVDGRTGGPRLAVNAALPGHVSAALLLQRAEPDLASESFAGTPLDPAGALLAAIAASGFAASADLEAMLLLVAMEGTMSFADEGAPDAEGACDLGIVVALKEEFRVLFARFNGRSRHVAHEGNAYYIFEVPAEAGARPYRCVATLIGEAGTDRAGVVAQKILASWSVPLLAIVGIAGGLHKDVRLGDVIVASAVDNYMAGAKATDSPSGTTFARTGDQFKTDHALLGAVRNFEFSHAATFARWVAGCKSRLEAHGELVQGLVVDDLLRTAPRQLEGALASGPLVVASEAFGNWIREGNRACLGVEMEASGLMIASHMDANKGAALVIRGVSDLGDGHKSRLDGVGGGVLREYAMQNATDFLWALLEAGLLPRIQHRSSAPKPKEAATERLSDTVLRALRERADERGAVRGKWRELAGSVGAAPGDVHEAAIFLNDDRKFRRALFEGDGFWVTLKDW